MSSVNTSETLFFAAEIVDDDSNLAGSVAVDEESLELDFEQLPSSEMPDCNCGGGAAVASSPQSRIQAVSANEAPQQQVKVSLMRIRNWPEFKVDIEKQCRRILGRKVCINVPHAFQRSCALEAFATVSHPNAEAIRGDIIACVRQAVAAGAVAGVLAGNVPAAIGALKVALTACLASKGRSQLNSLAVNISTETSCGDWRPR